MGTQTKLFVRGIDEIDNISKVLIVL